MTREKYTEVWCKRKTVKPPLNETVLVSVSPKVGSAFVHIAQWKKKGADHEGVTGWYLDGVPVFYDEKSIKAWRHLPPPL